MGSHASDQQTATAASSGAQAQDQQLAANAAKNQAYSDQSRQSLFGSYNPSTNSYSGGSVSPYLDPSKLNQNGLSGSYLNTYNNSSNALANTTKNSVSTTMQNMASRGMGKSPAGFSADQERQAYQTQAGQQGSLYTGAAQQQNTDAMNNYWAANNMLNSNASQTANLSLQGTQAAAGNYSNLYSTADQQTPSGWAVAGQTLAAMGAAAAPKPPCYIAAELWGGWDEPRVVKVREWMVTRFIHTTIGSRLVPFYARHGQAVASAIRRFPALRLAFTPLFDWALRKADAN